MTSMENLFGFNRPSRRLKLNNAFGEIDTRMTHMANGLAACFGRSDDRIRVTSVQLMVRAARFLLEGDAKESKRILDLCLGKDTQTTLNYNVQVLDGPNNWVTIASFQLEWDANKFSMSKGNLIGEELVRVLKEE